MATVLVVDPSPSVRETLRIVLGHEHTVRVAASLDALGDTITADVVVLGLPPPPRDERRLGAILARDLAVVPVLLLHPARDVDLGVLVPPDVPVELLPKPFDAYGVRARVRRLLVSRSAPRQAEREVSERHTLEFPFLARSAAAVVRRVLAADLPVVLIQGEPGTGVAAVARALHGARRPPGSFVAVDAARVAARDLARHGATRSAERGTLFVANLDRAPDDVQAEMLRLVDDARSDGPRMIVGAEADLAEIASAGRLLPELAYLASAVPIVLTPLRDRADDVPALVAAITSVLRPRLRLGEVVYRPATLERLRSYLWFGNGAELEAVVTRTLALHRPSVVEPEHLVFLPDETARVVASRMTPAPAVAASATAGSAATPAGSAALAGLDLEIVLGELAHELRNPMVTLKTVAQHFDGIVADPEARARFAVLMSDAVGRMDGVLETLLDFARFRAPSPRPVDLEALMDGVLGEQADDLARRDVHVERNGTGAGSVRADEAQILFAFRSLWRGLVSDVVPHSAVAVRGVAPGTIELEVRADPSVAARLARWVDPGPNGTAETPPLAWALAAALVERNGGALTMRRADNDGMVIRVAWPAPG